MTENSFSRSPTPFGKPSDGTKEQSSTGQLSETPSESPKSPTSFLDSQEWLEMSRQWNEATEQWKTEMEEWWENLPTEDQQRAFYNVCRLIYEGDVMKRRSYRGVLYDVFGWGPEAYVLGMEARYMDLHNLLYDAVEGDTKYTQYDLDKINQELEDAAEYDRSQEGVV